MKIDLDSTEPDVRIEIVPLIDVIFCILTFFILAAVTLTRQAAINVDLPRAGSGTTQMRQILIVSVDPIGQTYVEKLPVGKDQLYQAIVNFRKQNPEGMMVLYASRAASYNDVVQVLDLLRSAGGDRVALATLPGEGTASPLPSAPNGLTTPSVPNPANSPNSFNSTPAPNSFDFGTPGSSLPSPASPGKTTNPNSTFGLPSGSGTAQPRSTPQSGNN